MKVVLLAGGYGTRISEESPALPTMILCAGCSIWPLSVLRSAGVPDVRTGTWCSASWRSCSPAALPADPWLQHVPADGPAFTPAACIPPRTPGPPAAKGFSPPPVHFSSHLFLTLSNFTYTIFYTRPKKTGARWLSDSCRVPVFIFSPHLNQFLINISIYKSHRHI